MTIHPSPRSVPGSGERAAWLVPPAVLGGLGALALLGGGGAVAAAALSVQEHRVATTVTEPVDTVVVDGRAAGVGVAPAW